MGDHGHSRHGRKEGRGCCAPIADSWDHVSYNAACDEVYFRTKCRHHPSSRLATTDMGQKLGGGACAFFLGVAGPHRTKSPGPRPTSTPSGILVHPAVWPQRTMAENWGLCPFRGGGAGFPSNPMLRTPMPTSVPSGILIHAAVWPQ